MNPSDAHLAPAGKVVFPDAHDAPAVLAQHAVDPAVAGLVVGEFPEPEGRALRGKNDVFRAGVPEAAVDKDGQSVFAEDEVWFSGQGLVAAPAADAGGSHERNQAQFCRSIAGAPHQRHDLGPLELGEDVSHVESRSADDNGGKGRYLMS